MDGFQRLRAWFDDHREVAFDLLRIYLGLGLIVRGILFITDPSMYADLVGGATSFGSAVLMHFVALAHLGGGALLALGLLTRFAALVQIPILMGAVFLVHLEDGLFASSQSLEFSALVLAMLGLYFLFGAGPWSLDAYLFRREAPEEALAPVRPRRPRPAQVRRAEKRPVRTPRVQEEPAGPPQCPCGHTGDHPKVVAEPHYGLSGMIPFVFGISGFPKEVVYRCSDCNAVIRRTRDPNVLRQFYGVRS